MHCGLDQKFHNSGLIHEAFETLDVKDQYTVDENAKTNYRVSRIGKQKSYVIGCTCMQLGVILIDDK